MELKLGQLMNSQEIIQSLTKEEVKAKVAWRLTTLIKEMEEPVNRFHTVKNDLISKYGEEVEDSYSLSPESPNFKDFIKELNEVADEDITLNAKKISIDDIENVEISVDKLVAIDWLIEG